MGGGSARLLQGPLPNAMREGQEWVVVFVVQLQWTKGLRGLKELVCQCESHLRASGSETSKGRGTLHQ